VIRANCRHSQSSRKVCITAKTAAAPPEPLYTILFMSNVFAVIKLQVLLQFHLSRVLPDRKKTKFTVQLL
jgi:hypothetical protein